MCQDKEIGSDAGCADASSRTKQVLKHAVAPFTLYTYASSCPSLRAIDAPYPRPKPLKIAPLHLVLPAGNRD